MTIGKEGDVLAFEKMRELKEKLMNKYHINGEDFELSMGMSEDFINAVNYQ
jgi:uncharacterized pyridoxal phosphate-containing UPF0001 family protein